MHEFRVLAIRTLMIGIPCSLLGFFLVMMWGLSAQAGQANVLLTIAGIAGFILLLPTMLLGYVVEAVGGFEMAFESMLMIIAQFVGYLALVWAVQALYALANRRRRA